MRRLLFVACLFVVSMPLSAATSDGVLVPIFYGDPGAFGSLWRTRLTIFNRSDAPLPGITIVFGCAIPEGCPQLFPPKMSVSLVASNGFRYQNGFFLFPGVDNADVWYALRVYDQSRSNNNAGTDIPIVPLSAFTEKAMEILDVPNDPAFRVTLRLYAIPPATPRVRVTVLQDPTPDFFGNPLPPPAILKDTSYALQLSPFGPSSGSFSRPSGAVISDLLDGISASGPLRIEIQSATAGVPVWAFISITNNETQLVTVAVPRSFQ